MNCLICGKRDIHIRHIKTHNITIKNYYDTYIKGTLEGKCKCGNDTSFISLKDGYKEFCSGSCGSKYTLNRRIKTNLKKYGVENPFQNENVKRKIKLTNIKKYGVENPTQNTIIKQKTKITNIKKYGSPFYNQTDEYKSKVKNTNIKKYGVEHYSQTKEYKNSRKVTDRINYWVRYVTLLNAKNITPLFNKEYFIDLDNSTFKFKCIKCNKEFESNETHTQKIYCNSCSYNISNK